MIPIEFCRKCGSKLNEIQLESDNLPDEYDEFTGEKIIYQASFVRICPDWLPEFEYGRGNGPNHSRQEYIHLLPQGRRK